jgi:hypothetical protein
MALREFLDSYGMHWTVWSTIPGNRTMVPDNLRAGWLTFESGDIRRRLAPIPRGWEQATDDRLHLFCSAAEQLDMPRKSNPGMQEEASPG